jgi:hypothetical protein
MHPKIFDRYGSEQERREAITADSEAIALYPAPEQPGTMAEQLAAVSAFLKVPEAWRRRFPRTAWRKARETTIEHARRPSREDLIDG